MHSAGNRRESFVPSAESDAVKRESPIWMAIRFATNCLKEYIEEYSKSHAEDFTEDFISENLDERSADYWENDMSDQPEERSHAAGLLTSKTDAQGVPRTRHRGERP